MRSRLAADVAVAGKLATWSGHDVGAHLVEPFGVAPVRAQPANRPAASSSAGVGSGSGRFSMAVRRLDLRPARAKGQTQPVGRAMDTGSWTPQAAALSRSLANLHRATDATSRCDRPSRRARAAAASDAMSCDLTAVRGQAEPLRYFVRRAGPDCAAGATSRHDRLSIKGGLLESGGSLK